jgi:hypothetical protein
LQRLRALGMLETQGDLERVDPTRVEKCPLPPKWRGISSSNGSSFVGDHQTSNPGREQKIDLWSPLMNHPTFSSETIQAICEALQRAGVEFAFGIRDVSVQVIDRAMPRDVKAAGFQQGAEARTVQARHAALPHMRLSDSRGHCGAAA